MTAEKIEYVEEFGMMWERMGATRISGRILGYLLVCDKEDVSFQHLVDTLKVSKASISNNLKILEQIQFIEAFSIPGDRKTYYRARPVDMVNVFETRMSLVNIFLDVMQKAKKLKSKKSDSASIFIEEAIDFYGWLVENAPKFYTLYRSQKNK